MTTTETRPTQSVPACATPGCDRKREARGLCHRCYSRERAAGRLVVKRRVPAGRPGAPRRAEEVAAAHVAAVARARAAAWDTPEFRLAVLTGTVRGGWPS